MQDTWLTVEEVARLEDISVNAVYKRLQRDKYPARCIREGDTDKVQIRSIALSERAKAVLKGERPGDGKPHRLLDGLSDEEHEVLIRRYLAVKETQQYPPYSAERKAAILDVAQREGVTGRTVYRWLSIIENNGNWVLLVKRQVKRRGVDIHEILQSSLESHYIHKRNKKLAYREMMKVARELTLPAPSERTCRRYLQMMDERTGGLIYLGQRYKEYYDKSEPFLLRDWSGLHPLQLIVGDYKRLDIVVEWFDGKLFYPWASFWRDCGTRTLFYPSISDRPNSRGVAGSLRLVMKFWGIPEGLYIDNGKEYKARCLKNYEFAEEVVKDVDVPIEASLLLERLNTGPAGFQGNVIHAIPRNSRAKPIERAFGVGGVDQFTRGLKGWTGAHYKEMPDHTREMMARYRKAKSPDEIPAEFRAMHVTEFYAAMVEWINEINATPSRADDMMGLSPDEVWRRWMEKGWEPQTVNNDAEIGLLLSSSKRATLKRGYIRFRGETYTGDELKRHAARRGRSVPVIIRWDEMDVIGYQRHEVRRLVPRELVVYSAEESETGTLIGIADHYLGVPAGTQEGSAMMKRELAANRKITKELRGELRQIDEVGRYISEMREGESLNGVTLSKETVQLTNRKRFSEISEEREALQRLRDLKPRLIDNEDII